MLPSMAIPRAPPSSAPVSDIPEAAPAFSGGALPTTSSVVSVNTGDRASEITTEPTTTNPRPWLVPTWVSASSPPDAAASEVPSTNDGRKRWTKCGETFDPMMNPAAEGSDHRPASSGVSPRTSWRYCATKRK